MSTSSPDSSFAISEPLHDASSPSRHDSSILSQDIPPLAPNDSFDPEPIAEKHPKGKRKRTVAKDKMILEDAYKANPKPDKQARLDIVNRVSLNEKEVQIWFQNRRQNDRRKSRPLSSLELAALRFNGLHPVPADALTLVSAASCIDVPADMAAPVSANPQSVSPSRATTETSQLATQQLKATTTPRPHTNLHPQLSDTTPQTRQFSSSHNTQDAPPSATHSLSTSLGYLSNRWNISTSFSTPAGKTRDIHNASPSLSAPSSCTSDTTHNASQRHHQSNVRLSLSLEGKAELVANSTSPTRPSPHKSCSMPDLPRQRGFKRSYSALPTVTLPPISTLTSFLPPRLVRGRSRDVQAWQSCADAETRDELTEHAEQESSGSAVAAISLLRSTTTGLLQASNWKRNTPLSNTPRDTRYANKKARFCRTSSSLGRLENSSSWEHDDDETTTTTTTKPAGKVKVSSMLMSPNDSDKENWSPDEDGNAVQPSSRRPPLLLTGGPPSTTKATSNPRRPGRSGVLHCRSPGKSTGNNNGVNANTVVVVAPSRPSRPRGIKDSVDIFEDEETRVSRDANVEKFMRGQVSPSKKPDMDCVAGLLSLSQGAWR